MYQGNITMYSLGSSHVRHPNPSTSLFVGLGYTNRVHLRGCWCVTSQQKKSWHRRDLAALIETVTEAS